MQCVRIKKAWLSVPKQVDHEERRRHIAEALWRIVAKHGMEAVSLRDVAAEAGVSMGSVQHYFKTKDHMLEFALEFSSVKTGDRVRARLARELAGDPPPWAVLRACMVETLPIDEHTRTGRLVGIAYFIRALNEPSLRRIYLQGQPKLFNFFADMIRAAQEQGVTAPGIDPDKESMMLWCIADSLGSDILLDNSTPAEAMATADYYLRRLFPGVPEQEWPPPGSISTPESTPEPTNSTP